MSGVRCMCISGCSEGVGSRSLDVVSVIAVTKSCPRAV